MININSNDRIPILKTITIKFDNFFEYQTVLNILNNDSMTPRFTNPDELTLLFTYIYSYEGIIEYLINICKPLNIEFVTEGLE